MPATDAQIDRLALGMIDRSLPRAEWTHRGHWAFALWISRNRPDLAEPDTVRGLIMGYNEATGTANTDTGGYHHTITLASIRGARSVVAGQSSDASLAGMLDRLMASRMGVRDWLLDYWRHETLFSVAARRDWVEPDLAPLPF